MKLNRKGYMLAEIVIASVLAISIAYYLLNLTYKFKNTNEDIYQSYLYTQDKLLITKNIMADLERTTVTMIKEDSTNNIIDFTIIIPNGAHSKSETRRLQITKENGTSKIAYGKTEENDGTTKFVKTDVSYYEKTLNASLIVNDLSVAKDTDGLVVTIPVESIYDDNDYSIKLFANRSYYVNLGVVIDGILNSSGGYLENDNTIKVKLKVNDEYYSDIVGEEYTGSLCNFFPYGTKIEISDIQYNGVTINSTHNESFTVAKDTSIRLYFTTSGTTLNFNEQKNEDYDSANDACGIA